MMIEISHGYPDFPDFVLKNIERLPDFCQEAGITLRELSDTARVPMDIIARYRRHEKYPCRSRYNRMAKVLGLQKWKHTRRWE